MRSLSIVMVVGIGLLFFLEGTLESSVAVSGKDSWAMKLVPPERQKGEIDQLMSGVKGAVLLAIALACIPTMLNVRAWGAIYGAFVVGVTLLSLLTGLIPQYQRGERSAGELAVPIVLILVGLFISYVNFPRIKSTAAGTG